MISPEERQTLENRLKLRARGILPDDAVVAQIAMIARRHTVDAILGDLPPELIEPLRKRIEADIAEQEYFPASLPPVTSVDIVVIDSNAPVLSVRDYLHGAGIRSVGVTGEGAQAIASLWRQLPPDHASRCHDPPFGLRFYSDDRMICEASICWRCDDIYGQAEGNEFVYGFYAAAPVSQELLKVVKEIAGDVSNVSP